RRSHRGGDRYQCLESSRDFISCHTAVEERETRGLIDKQKARKFPGNGNGLRDLTDRPPAHVRFWHKSGNHATEFQCPLLEVKRIWSGQALMSAFDPKRTFASEGCCRAK